MIRARTVLLVVLAAVSVSACVELKGRKKDAPVATTPVIPPAPEPRPVTEAPPARPVKPPPEPRSCVPRTLPPPPRYPDSDAALRDAAGAADRYQLMAAGRLLRQRRLDELERVVAGCR